MALQFQETHDLLWLPFRQNTRWSFRWLFRDITKVVCSVQLSRSGEGEVAQSCPTLCDPMDCNLLGFSIHRILQARTLEWIAISFSRGSSQPRDRTRVSRIGGRRFNLWATRDAPGLDDLNREQISPGNLLEIQNLGCHLTPHRMRIYISIRYLGDL